MGSINSHQSGLGSGDCHDSPLSRQGSEPITFRPVAPNCRFHGRHAAAAISRWRASGRSDQSEPNLSRFAGIPVRTVWTHNVPDGPRELPVPRTRQRRSQADTRGFGQPAPQPIESGGTTAVLWRPVAAEGMSRRCQMRDVADKGEAAGIKIEGANKWKIMIQVAAKAEAAA